MVCKCGCPLFEGEIMCPDCLRPVKKSNRIEFKNGSVIEPIDSDNNVRSKRGQEQLKSAWSLIEDYYNSLPWYKKIITKIQWLLCIYYKNKKVKEDK